MAAQGRKGSLFPGSCLCALHSSIPRCRTCASLASWLRLGTPLDKSHPSAMQATSTRHYTEQDARLEYLAWRTWGMKQKKLQVAWRGVMHCNQLPLHHVVK